jgi:tetratricopeptide (TPR) repeat protein
MPAGSRPKSFTRLVCGGLVVGGLAALVPVQKQIDAANGIYGPIADVLYMPSGRLLGRLSLGNEGLLAAIYWTRVVQYFGRASLAKEGRFRLLAPLLQITTDLDPHLLIAYRFGAIFLTEKPPQGAGQPEAALALIRRGIARNPDYWRFWQDLGFIYYWDLKDYRRAAQAYLIGSRLPGALFFMKAMAARILLEGGDPQTSYDIWLDIYRQAGNDQLRRNAELHLTAIRATIEMKQLNDLLARFEKSSGHPAKSFQELVAAGWLRGIPVDPSGVTYQLGADGKAALGAKSQVLLYLAQ